MRLYRTGGKLMDKMVQKVQIWLMEHYNVKNRFETII